MPQPVGTTIDMLLELGQDAIIGALVLSVLVAALTAGAYLWLRRGKSDVTAILVSLIVIANLACMVTGAGFIQSRLQSAPPGTLIGGQRGTVTASHHHLGWDGTIWRRAGYPRRDHGNWSMNRERTNVPPDL